jgi:esterase/lipase superfamily enzyme
MMCAEVYLSVPIALNIPPIPQGKDPKKLDRLAQLADLLMSDGMYEIFEQSREKLTVAIRDKNIPKFVYKVGR